MPLALRLFLAAAAFAVAAVTIASLALLHIVPGWGVLFFYVLPTVFFVLWTLGELAPSSWRRSTVRMRRAWRTSGLSAPPSLPDPVAHPPGRVGDRAFGAAARGWLTLLRAPLRVVRSRRARRLFEVVFVLAAAALAALVVRQIVDNGWPLRSASSTLTAAAVAFFLATFALRALAWQLLFRPFERPRSLALVASNATAAVAAIALPSRIDDAIAIAVLRKLARRAPSVGTLALSLFLLGLLDMAALAPFAAFATFAIHASYAVHVGMAAVTGVGVGAALLTAALPTIRGSGRLTRYRLGRWLAVHAPASHRDAAWALALVAASWLTRASGLYVLLDAVGLRAPFSVATAYVAAAAGASTLPVGPAGAATQAGVGAAVLAGAGIETGHAVALAIAAQALTVAAAAALAVFGVGISVHGRRRRLA